MPFKLILGHCIFTCILIHIDLINLIEHKFYDKLYLFFLNNNSHKLISLQDKN